MNVTWKRETVWKGFSRVYTRYGFEKKWRRHFKLKRLRILALKRISCFTMFAYERSGSVHFSISSSMRTESRKEMKRNGGKKKKWCYIILKYRRRVSYKWEGWHCNICIHFNRLFSCSLLVGYFTFENAWRVMDGEISIIKHGNTSVFVRTYLLFPCVKTIRFIRRLLSR